LFERSDSALGDAKDGSKGCIPRHGGGIGSTALVEGETLVVIKESGDGDGMVHVTFELPAEVDARQVALVGDFNSWSTTAHLLERHDGGRYRTTLALEPGRVYRFRYLLDGERWENDWAADDYEPNAFGGEDSVVRTDDVGE
jgi:1,4-alpha-glucan branching enzyme